MPLVYELDDELRPTVKGGRYLDPEAAAEAAAAVANQGASARGIGDRADSAAGRASSYATGLPYARPRPRLDG